METQILVINQNQVSGSFLQINYRYLSLGEKINVIKILQKSELGLIVSGSELKFLRDMGLRTKRTISIIN